MTPAEWRKIPNRSSQPELVNLRPSPYAGGVDQIKA
jgi:hypothetical protein